MLDLYFPLYIFVFLFTLFLTVFIEKKIIPILALKAQQPIYTEGPKWHLKKSGTPTMGGIAFVISVVIAIYSAILIAKLMLSKHQLISLFISLIYGISNALIGIIDDSKKLKKSQNKGLSAGQKMLLQLIFAVMFLFSRKFFLNDTTIISFYFGEFDIGFFYYPLSLIILLGIVNCANLTDGIDGLAASVAFSIGISLLYLSAALTTEVALISSAIIGASIGFLVFNIHPAKIFMGDTGSLFFGSIVASTGFMLGNPIIVLFIGGVYVIEGISVILQVLVYKLTHKRLFKMAPIHHHLEKCGWAENRICIIAILITFIISVPVYIFYIP